jgi:two-component system, NarL family, nitrate/nitrite response regulator NarL
MIKKIKVAIADDHPMVIDGLVNYLASNSNIEVVATTNRVADVPRIVSVFSPDILLMDYHFNNEEQSGMDICELMQKEYTNVKVIIISSYSDVSLIRRFIEVGASGYLLKTASKQEFIEAIQNVYIGVESFGKDVRELLLKEKLSRHSAPSIRFTKTEKEILKLIIDGCSTDEIAKKLFREKSTIDSHRKSILFKLQQMDVGNPKPSKNISHYIAKFNISHNLNCL